MSAIFQGTLSFQLLRIDKITTPEKLIIYKESQEQKRTFVNALSKAVSDLLVENPGATIKPLLEIDPENSQLIAGARIIGGSPGVKKGEDCFNITSVISIFDSNTPGAGIAYARKWHKTRMDPYKIKFAPSQKIAVAHASTQIELKNKGSQERSFYLPDYPDIFGSCRYRQIALSIGIQYI